MISTSSLPVTSLASVPSLFFEFITERLLLLLVTEELAFLRILLMAGTEGTLFGLMVKQLSVLLDGFRSPPSRSLPSCVPLAANDSSLCLISQANRLGSSCLSWRMRLTIDGAALTWLCTTNNRARSKMLN
jgi:hypothetical protein